MDKQTVAKIARLARIRVSEEEKEHFARELSGIFTWMEQLAEVDTQNVPQMVSVGGLRLPWRADLVTDGNHSQEVTVNAPRSDYGCFVVPKVME